MSKSNYAEVESLKYFLTAGAMATRPTGWWISLHTADPTDAGGSEVTGAGYSNYARIATTFAAPTLVNAGPSTTANAAIVTFAALAGTGVTVTHFAVNDALTLGNPLYIGQLGLPKVLAAGDVPAFAIGDLLFNED